MPSEMARVQKFILSTFKSMLLTDDSFFSYFLWLIISSRRKLPPGDAVGSSGIFHTRRSCVVVSSVRNLGAKSRGIEHRGLFGDSNYLGKGKYRMNLITSTAAMMNYFRSFWISLATKDPRKTINSCDINLLVTKHQIALSFLYI